MPDGCGKRRWPDTSRTIEKGTPIQAFYPWIVLLHISGAFLFAISHGSGVWVAIQLVLAVV
jgi:hypothetical protein